MIEDFLDIEPLRSGRLSVVPKGQLGTCGWYPKPWTCVFVTKRENPIRAFLASNKNWSWNDFKQGNN